MGDLFTAAPSVNSGIDIASILGVGGPVAGIFAILGYLLNAYLAKRKDDREDKRLKTESESGIVETTGKALEIVRSQMDRMELDQLALRDDNKTLANTCKTQDQEIRDQKLIIEKLEHRINWLEIDNRELRDEIAVLRGDRPNGI